MIIRVLFPCTALVVIILTCPNATDAAQKGELEIAKKELPKLLQESDFQKIWNAVNGWKKLPKSLQKQIICLLVEKLDSAKELKLVNYADTTVESRNMPFHGHGEILRQDIFLENGRCAWAIEQVLDIRLPAFTEKMQRADLERAILESCIQIIKAMQLP